MRFALLILAELIGDVVGAESCAGDTENCQSSMCCSTAGRTCFEKDATWASCRASCTPGISPDDPPEYRTPWSCQVLPVVFQGSVLPRNFQPPAGSPVARHGQLLVQGRHLLDKHGQHVQLRGMSLFWSQWSGRYWNSDVVNWLVQDWNITLLRAAMGVESGGYLENQNVQKSLLVKVVDAAVKAGIYVVIDWHDHAAHNHVAEASLFFDEMAQLYGHLPNVLFETFNEPLNMHSWAGVVKPYHEEIIPVIRNHTNNLIILGTPTWSQDVDIAAQNPISAENIAYTLHFYASTHKQYLRDKAEVALQSGITLFVTEWGTCEASGNGKIDLDEARAWLDFLDVHGISHANWAVNDKNESCSALLPGTSSMGQWDPQLDLTQSGRFVRSRLLKEETHVTSTSVAPDGSGLSSGSLTATTSGEAIHATSTSVLPDGDGLSSSSPTTTSSAAGVDNQDTRTITTTTHEDTMSVSSRTCLCVWSMLLAVSIAQVQHAL
eukprot:TRINITY_DN9728_c0_g1_i1.p1 TRINITY_DN9728_c0_g1~~TRINITY_DN9728_c0_g1_i1.p1  ORF type:complete len:493 (-),score=77.13 TRINITY_DN9728_c0_g1_i1:231-1709(-)